MSLALKCCCTMTSQFQSFLPPAESCALPFVTRWLRQQMYPGNARMLLKVWGICWLSLATAFALFEEKPMEKDRGLFGPADFSKNLWGLGTERKSRRLPGVSVQLHENSVAYELFRVQFLNTRIWSFFMSKNFRSTSPQISGSSFLMIISCEVWHSSASWHLPLYGRVIQHRDDQVMMIFPLTTVVSLRFPEACAPFKGF